MWGLCWEGCSRYEHPSFLSAGIQLSSSLISKFQRMDYALMLYSLSLL